MANWFYSKSRVKGEVKKPLGFEAWFYTGPTRYFGHAPCKKSHR